MSREIKFRYKYTDGVNWMLSYFDITQIANGYPFDVLSDNPLLKKYRMFGEPDQFTGLTDKNGKDIYEGDVVQYIIPNDMEKKYRSVVIYSGCQILPFATTGRNFEVIGNIYENPELLTQTK